jgi:hypothetical protein
MADDPGRKLMAVMRIGGCFHPAASPNANLDYRDNAFKGRSPRKSQVARLT